MTHTIEIPDYVTVVTPAQEQQIWQLASHAARLLEANTDLTPPVYVSITQCCQEISLQFADTAETFRALAEWAERFGGTITGQPHVRRDGTNSVHCQVQFTDHGVKVEGYAFISPADTATT